MQYFFLCLASRNMIIYRSKMIYLEYKWWPRQSIAHRMGNLFVFLRFSSPSNMHITTESTETLRMHMNFTSHSHLIPVTAIACKGKGRATMPLKANSSTVALGFVHNCPLPGLPNYARALLPSIAGLQCSTSSWGIGNQRVNSFHSHTSGHLPVTHFQFNI